MPYVSDAQRAKFHALLAEGKIDPKVVAEWDAASKGLRLPDRAAPTKTARHAQKKYHRSGKGNVAYKP